MIALILGVPSTGKSRRAEDLTLELAGGGRRVYLATMTVLDAEGRRVPAIGKVRDALKLVKADEKGSLSRGGMDSKLKAVANAAKGGANVVIANASRPHVLTAIFSGRDVGTFVPGSAL